MAKGTFRGLEREEPDEPFTIHMRPKEEDSEPEAGTPTQPEEKVLAQGQQGHFSWRRVEASPDDPMFGKLHIVSVPELKERPETTVEHDGGQRSE